MKTEIETTKDFDKLYPEAVLNVHETKITTISHLQRVLLIGYNRAARLLEAMEADGIVGPLKPDGTRDYLEYE